ncbi:hypothetical protein ACFOG5_04885 [Pedobacter fastidiosus]|uniref:hypothetical protein n=1 Tax=Pedobacter fastidiosus TaxID=2765361 RepID=UPI00361FD078
MIVLLYFGSWRHEPRQLSIQALTVRWIASCLAMTTALHVIARHEAILLEKMLWL